MPKVFSSWDCAWAVDVGDAPTLQPDLPRKTLTGGPETWPACQEAARHYRSRAEGITAPSAALRPGGAHGWRVDGGLQSGPNRDGKVIALFGPRPDLIGWLATKADHPSAELLATVQHF